MDLVIPRPDSGQVDLGPLPPSPPVLNTRIDLLLDLGVDQALDVSKLDTTLLSSVNLLPLVLILLLRISLSGVNPLLGNGSECAPSEIASKNLLGISINATPDRFQLLV